MWTLKNGQLYFHDADQASLYHSRIENEGHTTITDEEARAILNPPAVLTPESVKAAITQKHWEVETGGITLPTGVGIATGIDDQNRITSVVANAQRAGVVEVDFKALSGWIRITLAELQAVAVAVALHVQACFSAERAHHEAIDALVTQHEGDAEGLQAALAAYDVGLGWPETDHQNVVPEDEKQALLNPVVETVERDYKHLTGLAKLDLFTPAEQQAVIAAVYGGDVEVAVFYERFKIADYVTYSNPETEIGLQLLIGKGLITESRKDEIVAEMTSERQV